MSNDKPTAEEQAAAAAAAAEKKSAKKKSLPPVQVQCARGERFCRAGVCFGKEPTVVTDYTQEQLEAWEAEPNLVVTALSADAA